jgi:hypothetical protein
VCVQEDNCFRFLQEILVSIQQQAALLKAAKGDKKAEDDATAAKEEEDRPPRAAFKDLEQVYLPGGTNKTVDEWMVELLPIETVELP